jgi:hypothetical protein
MQKIFWLALMMNFTNLAFAEVDATGTDSTFHMVIQSSNLDCKKSSSSDYLSSCIATVAYEVNNSSNMDAEAKVSCNVAINYLKSVMGIRDTGSEQNSQIHMLAANSSEGFNMSIEFKFATQTEANNAEIKAVDCQIDTIQP